MKAETKGPAPPGLLQRRHRARQKATHCVAFLGTEQKVTHAARTFSTLIHMSHARVLYASLRDADAKALSTILILPPDTTDGLWAAVLDRLHRAALPLPSSWLCVGV